MQFPAYSYTHPNEFGSLALTTQLFDMSVAAIMHTLKYSLTKQSYDSFLSDLDKIEKIGAIKGWEQSIKNKNRATMIRILNTELETLEPINKSKACLILSEIHPSQAKPRNTALIFHFESCLALSKHFPNERDSSLKQTHYGLISLGITALAQTSCLTGEQMNDRLNRISVDNAPVEITRRIQDLYIKTMNV